MATEAQVDLSRRAARALSALLMHDQPLTGDGRTAFVKAVEAADGYADLAPEYQALIQRAENLGTPV